MLQTGAGSRGHGQHYSVTNKQGVTIEKDWPTNGQSSLKNMSADMCLQMVALRMRALYPEENAAADEARKSAPSVTAVAMSEIARAVELVQGQSYEKPCPQPDFVGLPASITSVFAAFPRFHLSSVTEQYATALDFARSNVTQVQRLRLVMHWSTRARSRITYVESFCGSEIASLRHELDGKEEYDEADVVFMRDELAFSVQLHSDWVRAHAAASEEIRVLELKLQTALAAECDRLAEVTRTASDQATAARVAAAAADLVAPPLLQLRPTSGVFHLLMQGYLDAVYTEGWPTYLP